MPKRGKKYIQAAEKIDNTQKYLLEDALKMVKNASTTKFDETVDVAVKLGVNPKHADQMVRGAVVYPNGLGKEVKVLVFAKGEKEKEAIDAGADFTGLDDLVKKIQEGWLQFDKVIATPDVMGAVGKLGKILGPRGLMPNPKVGTVTFDVGRAVKEMKSGRVEFRVEKAGIVHAPVGKVSFEEEKLKSNVVTLLEALVKNKPATSKGVYLKTMTISSTMGPGVKVDPLQIRAMFRM